MFGLVGWAIAVPAVGGIALGTWLDAVWPQRFSWKIALLFAGIVMGCFNAWWWVRRESKRN
jgi:ATP synthase protein I